MDKYWKWIPEYEDLYSVSKNGEIFSTYKYRKLKPRPCGHGYYSVCLSKNGIKKYKYIHKIVLETFVGQCSKGMEAMHIDNNPKNNKLDNLKYGTKLENMQHRKLTGSQKGSKNGNAKLNNENVIKIKKLIKDGLSDKEISNYFNVDRRNIRHIRNGKTWIHL